jgi:DNA-binding response OmpR family regulator
MGVIVERKILIVVDNIEAGQVWEGAIRQLINCSVILCKTSEVLAGQLTKESLDLILVEPKQSTANELTFCQKLRETTIIPLLLMHDKCNEDYILSAYHAGIDEFICKPVSPFLLVAKIQAWLNRSWTVPVKTLHTLQNAGLTLKPLQRQVVTRDGQPVQLTNLEFRLLYLLMGNPGRPISTEQILDKVWDDYQGDSVQLKNVIYRLRRKIEPDSTRPIFIHTVSGYGYGFAIDSQPN